MPDGLTGQQLGALATILLAHIGLLWLASRTQ